MGRYARNEPREANYSIEREKFGVVLNFDMRLDVTLLVHRVPICASSDVLMVS